MAELLEVKHLSVSFDTPEGEVEAVRDVSFFVTVQSQADFHAKVGIMLG